MVEKTRENENHNTEEEQQQDIFDDRLDDLDMNITDDDQTPTPVNTTNMVFERLPKPYTATNKNGKPVEISLVQIYIDELLEETIIQKKVLGRIPVLEGGGGEDHISSQALFKRKHREASRELLANLANEIDLRDVVALVVVGVCGGVGGHAGGTGGIFVVAVGGGGGGIGWWYLWSQLVVLRDSEKLPEQSQPGNHEDEERYKNNIDRDGKESINGHEENKSEEEEEEDKQEDEEVKDYSNEVFCPRILRWLAAKSNIRIKEVDLFNPSNNAVVPSWIVPTEQELGMTSVITLGLIDTITDPTVELIKKELAGPTSIRREVRQGQPNVETLHDQPIEIHPGASSRGIASVVVDVSGRYADAAASHDDYVDAREKLNMFENTPFTGPSHPYIGLSHPYTGPSHPSSPLCSHCKYEECKDNQDKLFEKIEAIAKAVEKLKSERGVIPCKKVREPYTPTYVKEILCLMRARQVAYPEAYDATDRIMDLDFYKNFKDRYDDISKRALTLGGTGFYLLVFAFQWDEEMIKYVRGEMPNPHDKIWTKAKRILRVMNRDGIRYRAIEILLGEGKIKVYDCNLPPLDEAIFLPTCCHC
ncbi:hypothetical protein FXO37_25845 [Capsicum annuum]|nr:hypothetical protein FXO37_25845 [Capsicum annuum]